MSNLLTILLVKLFMVAFGLGWFAYNLRRFKKWQERRADAPVRYWLITVYSVGCMAFGLLFAGLALTMDLQGI